MADRSLTVVIPTLGGSNLLDEAIRLLQADPVCSQIVVVINGPGAEGSAPLLHHPVEVVRLAAAGLSAARNAGLAAARNGVVAFLDDDALPRAGWGGALVAAFERPGVGAAGGPAKLGGTIPLPAWLGPGSAAYLGIIDLGEDEHLCPPWQYPYGCNFAVHKHVALEVGGFREDLGYRGSTMLPNEEAEFFRRLQCAGHQVLYTPKAVVDHHVRVDRVTLRAMMRRAFWQGVGDRRTQRIHSDLPLERPGRSAVLATRWAAAAVFRGALGQRQAADDQALRSIRALGSIVGLVWNG